jgi:hypothetical protein
MSDQEKSNQADQPAGAGPAHSPNGSRWTAANWADEVTMAMPLAELLGDDPDDPEDPAVPDEA